MPYIDAIFASQRRAQTDPTPCEWDPETGLWLKREDRSVTGSHKFRPMAWQMGKMKNEKLKIKNVVVPTSGNAGIAAAIIGRELGIRPWCFVSPDIDSAKATEIQRQGGRLLASTRSVRYSGFVHKTMKILRLRQSTDAEAVEGYWTLAAELVDQVPDVDAIFNFSTSGTSTLGIYEGYKRLGLKCPEIHVVRVDGRTKERRDGRTEERKDGETEEVMNSPSLSLSRSYGRADGREGVGRFSPSGTGLAIYNVSAGHGGLARSRRDKDLVRIVDETGGAFHSSGDFDISVVDVDTSPEGKACIVAATRYRQEFPDKKVVVICSGREWTRPDVVPTMESCEEVFGKLPGEFGEER